MSRKFTVKEIAYQAGLSPATVDRALHGRPNLRQITRDRVAAALQELDVQYAQGQNKSTRVTLDVVMQAPTRFSSAVRAAFEQELPLFTPVAFRARFHLAERMQELEIIALLRAIARRGSHGVVLKLPATPRIEACLRDLTQANIPVVTYVTDVAPTCRLAYVGMENRRAGATAAYLMHRFVRAPAPRVLVSLSSQMFQGEELRRQGFLAYLKNHAPQMAVTTISEGFGVNRSTKDAVAEALERHNDIQCIYSIGGGNGAIVQAFAEAARPYEVFAAHDLDRTNQSLLDQGALSFVIHHSLQQDARRICLIFGKFHRHISKDVEIGSTEINIACPPVKTALD